MTYFQFKLLKFFVLLVAVGIWQFWRGMNGLPVNTDQDYVIKAQRNRKP